MQESYCAPTLFLNGVLFVFANSLPRRPNNFQHLLRNHNLTTIIFATTSLTFSASLPRAFQAHSATFTSPGHGCRSCSLDFDNSLPRIRLIRKHCKARWCLLMALSPIQELAEATLWAAMDGCDCLQSP